MKQKLWTVEEVSEFLNVKRSTLYSWVRNGIIPAHKFGASLRFDPIEIDKVVEASRVTPVNIPTLRKKSSKTQDIDRVINKVIDDVTGRRYTTAKRETSPSQGLRKEV
jgi:excisionase family DNA binding protein